MSKILLYISICLLALSSPLKTLAQEKQKENVWRYEGPRIGVDLSRFASTYLQSADRWGWELQGDVPVKGYWFPTVEVGMMGLNDRRDNFHYQANGVYGRLGTDFNILRYQNLQDEDLVFVGLRYGYSRFNQQAEDVKYSNFWGDYTTSIPKRNMNAHWGEFVFGMKGEIFKNFFLGWSLRVKFMVSETKDPHMSPYIVPGFGKTNVDIPMDFSYGIYYRIPLWRTKKMPKAPKMEGAKHIDESASPDNNNNQQNSNGNGFQNLRGGQSQGF
jgi:hypothetical protein